ncbi:PepSY domain-containing protein [Rhodocyclus tenuis]|uniref:PepSY domain-containing protein n=2 Tax=Rhodocyclus TaxID=1064 RepID=A0A6L5JVN7_RHOTE|nr:PepSY domain-containing protein [Rhodocyclus gracilis]
MPPSFSVTAVGPGRPWVAPVLRPSPGFSPAVISSPDPLELNMRVPTDLYRRYRLVHTWTGICAGLALFIAFYAGALTMFKEPLARWAAPPRAVALTDLHDSEALIAQTLAARPDAAREFTLDLRETEDVPARLTWRKSRHDDAPWSAALDAAGQVQITQLHPVALAQWIDVIHRTAAIPGTQELGEYVMGGVSLMYIVALVSGLVLVLPSLVRDLFALRLGANLKRMWMDAHNLMGITSLPFHLLIGLSAVVFAFHDSIYDAQDAVVYDHQLKSLMQAGMPPPPRGATAAAAPMLPPAALLARAQALSPQFEPISMTYRNAGTAAASVRIIGRDSRYMLRQVGWLVVSPVSGEILNSEAFPGRQSAWDAPVAALFALHFGSFGGEPVRWGYFLLGLAGAFMFYSGNRLWIVSRRRQAVSAQGREPRSLRFMAAATHGVCFGGIAGISLSLVAAKCLHGQVDDLAAWYRGAYYVTFLAALGWAFARGGDQAARGLARAAAGATLAIPLASLTGYLWPATGWWVNESAASLGVDVMALLAAGALWWIGQALAADGRHSSPALAGEEAAQADAQTTARPLPRASRCTTEASTSTSAQVL